MKNLTVGLSSNNIALESKFTLNKKFVIPIRDIKFDEHIGSGEFASMHISYKKILTVTVNA